MIGTSKIELCSGNIIFEAGDTLTSVSFEKRFSSIPIVICTVVGSNKSVFAENVTVDGFDVIITDAGNDVNELGQRGFYSIQFQAINVIR